MLADGHSPRLLDVLRLIRLQTWFLMIALVWGVLEILIVPPFQVPDEGDHFFRAWAVSTGEMTADRQGMIDIPAKFDRLAGVYLGAVGGGGGLQPLPISLAGEPGFTSWPDLFDGSGPAGSIQIPSRVANYPLFGYVPQAAAIASGRAAGASPLACFYLARLANLLASIVMVWLGIRLAPYGKEAFLLVGLMPMTMYEFASVSCDAAAIAGALLFVALALRASRLPRLSRVDIAELISAAALLLNVKPGYWALILLTALIPAATMAGRSRKWALVATCLGASAALAGIDYAVSTASGTVSGSGGPAAQIAFILTSPLGFLAIFATNVRSQWQAIWFESVGILGWFSVALPTVAYFVVLLAGPVLAYRSPGDAAPKGHDRVMLAGLAFLVFATFAAILFVFLTPVGGDKIAFQGRYFVPVWLLALLSVYGLRTTPAPRTRPAIISMALFLGALTIHAVASAYS